MFRMHKIASASAVAAALAILPVSGVALAHGEAGGQATEFYEHMDLYADNITNIINNINDIVADYEPHEKYVEDIDALIEQWESVEFHLAVETNAMPLYPPIWAALGAFSTALKDGAPVATVEAKADHVAAALWQGYGGLKLLAARREQGHGHEQAHASTQASGQAVIGTINNNLDQVLVLYKKGRNDAALDLIYATYMNYFEGIEGELIEQDAELVSALEVDFNASLPRLIKNGAPVDEVADQIDAMQDDLDNARALLKKAEQDETSVF